MYCLVVVEKIRVSTHSRIKELLKMRVEKFLLTIASKFCSLFIILVEQKRFKSATLKMSKFAK